MEWVSPAVAVLGALLAGVFAALWWRARGRHATCELVSASPRRLALLAECAHDVLLMIDGDGRIVEANARAVESYGYARTELIGLHIWELRAPAARDALLGQFYRARQGERFTFETVHRRRDGSEFPVEVSTGSQEIDGKRWVLSIVRDVTARQEREEERRRMQAQLALSDRMASLGTLAASVAHEINNPLSYVISNVDMARTALQRLAPAGEAPQAVLEIGELLGEASEGAVRVHQIAGDLKVLSSGREEDDALVDVRAVIRSTANLARRLVAERARLITELPEVPWVTGNPARLGQVFLNLLVNAAQAIPPGNASANRVRAATSVDAGGRVVVEVEDTGVGITPEHLGRIFDPFFTTKPAGVGTGLGLAICQSIVAEHGGAIRVESEPGRGTTFRVLLPAALPDAVRVRAPSPGSPPAPGGAARRGRILVVDDEPFVLRALERILSPRHDVILASGGSEALTWIGEGPPLDGVLCDVMMPEMNGMELYREIARRDPGLAAQVVFVTGGALAGEVRDFLDAARAPVVEKPFAPAEVLEAVGRLVGGAARSHEVG